MTMLLTKSILLVVLLVLASVKAEVISESKKLSSREEIRYHYDDSVSNPCANMIILGVGTAMDIGSYDKISNRTVYKEPIVAVIVDFNSGRIRKQSSEQYAALANTIQRDMKTIIPVCKAATKTSIFVGGHSVSGQAAMGAVVDELLSFTPTGYLGLDPFEREADTSIKMKIPGMFWGFTETTCMVDPETAAKAGYRATVASRRVLYLVENPSGGGGRPTHCSFTDGGCPPFLTAICPANKAVSPWVRDSVGKSMSVFVAAIKSGHFVKAKFVIKDPQVPVQLYFNQDIVEKKQQDLTAKIEQVNKTVQQVSETVEQVGKKVKQVSETVDQVTKTVQQVRKTELANKTTPVAAAA